MPYHIIKRFKAIKLRKLNDNVEPSINPYLNFVREFRNNNKHLPVTKCTKRAAHYWRHMTDKEKKPYKAQALIAQNRRRQKIDEWNAHIQRKYRRVARYKYNEDSDSDDDLDDEESNSCTMDASEIESYIKRKTCTLSRFRAKYPLNKRKYKKT